MARRVTLTLYLLALVGFPLFLFGFPHVGGDGGMPVVFADGRTDAGATAVYSESTPQASESTQAAVELILSAEGQPGNCSNDLAETLGDGGVFYLCVTILNSGDVTLSQHTLTTPQQEESVFLESQLAPGDVMTVTSGLLDSMGQATILGPFTFPTNQGESAERSVNYEGVGLALGDGETTPLTATASESVTVSSDERLAQNLLPTITPTPPVASTLPSDVTPTSTPASQSPLATPTMTAISVSPLATPPPPSAQTPFDGDAAMAASLTATAEAAATIGVLDATATAIGNSPLDAPTATTTETPTQIPIQTPTAILEPTATPDDAVAVVAPPAAGPQRPFNTPTPAPTPDYLLMAAQTFDRTLLAATWIWFMAGSLVFFAIAGVLAGFSFWRNERDRYAFEVRYPTGAELVADDPFPTPPPPARNELEDDLKDWPESLP